MDKAYKKAESEMEKVMMKELNDGIDRVLK